MTWVTARPRRAQSQQLTRGDGALWTAEHLSNSTSHTVLLHPHSTFQTTKKKKPLPPFSIFYFPTGCAYHRCSITAVFTTSSSITHWAHTCRMTLGSVPVSVVLYLWTEVQLKKKIKTKQNKTKKKQTLKNLELLHPPKSWELPPGITSWNNLME